MHPPCRIIHPSRTRRNTARNPKRAKRLAKVVLEKVAVPAKVVREKVVVKERVVVRAKVEQDTGKGVPCRERDIHGQEKGERMETEKGPVYSQEDGFFFVSRKEHGQLDYFETSSFSLCC